MNKTLSWTGVLFALLLVSLVWLFFIRSGPALAPVEVEKLSCQSGEAREALGQRARVVYYSRGCAAADAEEAAEIRNEAEEGFDLLSEKSLDSFYYPVLVELWDRSKWKAQSAERAAGAIRVPLGKEDRQFFIMSALASLALSQSYPGLRNNADLAEGYAIYALGNPYVPASGKAIVFYETLSKNKAALEERLLLCRERQCSLSKLL